MSKWNERPPAETAEESRTETEAFAETVIRGMKRAVKDAINEHHRAGYPVVIWRDGQIVRWYPDGSYRPVESAAEEQPVAVKADAAPD